MPRYIDADALKEAFLIECKDVCDGTDEFDTKWGASQELIEKVIDSAPTADVELVSHGRWVRHGEGYDCSECKKWVDGDIHYSFEDRTPLLPVCCPFCGAKMDEEEV